VLAQVAMSMCGSEATFAAGGAQVTPDECLEVARGKTAALIAACCELGALSAGAPEASVEALRDYGQNLGLAFQITDDLLDVEGDARLMGKNPGSDAAKNKKTYPALLGIEASRESAKHHVEEALRTLSRFDASAEPLRAVAKHLLVRKG